MEQLAKVQEKTRDENEALMDRVHQMNGENGALRKDNERLKVSDSKGLKIKC